MKLNIKDIQEIAHNCLEVYTCGDKFGFRRFTEKQMQLFQGNDVFNSRSHCTAGICLDFYTDSHYIKFDYSLGLKSSRDWYSFDIYINDVLEEVIYGNYSEKQSGKIEFPIENDGIKRITIYLPYTAETFINDVEISENATIASIKEKRKKLLCMGDSITQGFDAQRTSFGFAVQLARYNNMELLNQGIGAYCYNQAVLDENLPYKPDIMIIAYGTNDWSKCKSRDEFFSQANDFLNKAASLYKDIPIYVILPVWRRDSDVIKPMGSFYSLRETLHKICENYGNLKMIDGFKLVPHYMDFFTDNVHLTDLSHSCYALNMTRNMSDK